VGLPSEEGRGVSYDLPFFAEHADLVAQPTQVREFRGGQPVMLLARVELRLA
jgi:hypothetical protein